MALRLALKALNDTIELRRLVPSLLKFYQLPRLSGAQPPATQKEILASIAAFPEDAENIMSDSRINCALHINLLAGTHSQLGPGDTVHD